MSSAAHIGNILREIDALISSWPTDTMGPQTGAMIGALSMSLRAVTNEYVAIGAITNDEVEGLLEYARTLGGERTLN